VSARDEAIQAIAQEIRYNIYDPMDTTPEKIADWLLGDGLGFFAEYLAPTHGGGAEIEWESYASRTQVPKPIRGTRDWNDEHSAFIAGFASAINHLKVVRNG